MVSRWKFLEMMQSTRRMSFTVLQIDRRNIRACSVKDYHMLKTLYHRRLLFYYGSYHTLVWLANSIIMGISNPLRYQTCNFHCTESLRRRLSVLLFTATAHLSSKDMWALYGIAVWQCGEAGAKSPGHGKRGNIVRVGISQRCVAKAEDLRRLVSVNRVGRDFQSSCCRDLHSPLSDA